MTIAGKANVIVHPLVLLSVVDHYTRVAEHTKKRVVGLLLGQSGSTSINVANSFALPFEEDAHNADIWFLDHNYLEEMVTMFKKVNSAEVVVGWYHTGPKLRTSDLAINELIKTYTYGNKEPVLVVVDVDQPDGDRGLPVDSYIVVDQVHGDTMAISRTFSHLPSEIQAEEAEEIGVEHLLREVKDNSGGSLANRVNTTFGSWEALVGRLKNIHSYLEKVSRGELPVNHDVLRNLQTMFNLLSKLTLTGNNDYVKLSNDRFLVIYLSSLVRASVQMHQLIDNKIETRELESGNLAADDKKDKKNDAEAKADTTPTDKVKAGK